MFTVRHNHHPVASEDLDAPAIEVRGLVKVFRAGVNAARALDGVDLVVQRGEMVAIMGPSGSGKSTLRRCLRRRGPARRRVHHHVLDHRRAAGT